MRSARLMTLSLALSLFTSSLFAKEIALTFDDSPRFAKGYFDGKTRANKLIQALKDADVEQVAFFSVSSRLNEEGTVRLNQYANAGHIIANHTHTHPNFSQLSSEEYISNFKQAHEKLSKFPNFRRWFRFPYLREGNTMEKRDAMRTALSKMGYKNVYITVNNYDWYMENQFQKEIKKNPKLDLAKMRDYYVDVLVESAEDYDQLAQKHLGRSPKHIFLLHEMDITALFIDDLVAALRKKGWKIITPEQALSDDIASYQTKNVYPFNPGRIGEIAKDNGQKKQLWNKGSDEAYLDKRFAEEVLGVSLADYQAKQEKK